MVCTKIFGLIVCDHISGSKIDRQKAGVWRVGRLPFLGLENLITGFSIIFSSLNSRSRDRYSFKINRGDREETIFV